MLVPILYMRAVSVGAKTKAVKLVSRSVRVVSEEE